MGDTGSDEEGEGDEGQTGPTKSKQVMVITGMVGANLALLTLSSLQVSASAVSVLPAGTGKASTRLMRNMFRQCLSLRISVLVSMSLFALATFLYASKKDNSPMRSAGVAFVMGTGIMISQDVVKRWQLPWRLRVRHRADRRVSGQQRRPIRFRIRVCRLAWDLA